MMSLGVDTGVETSSKLLITFTVNSHKGRNRTASYLEMSAEGPLRGDWKSLYDETTLFIRPLQLTMSLVQIMT